jgi:Protein of unknown function (DUF1161)
MAQRKTRHAVGTIGAGLALWCLAAPSSQAATCDEIRARIDARIRASGVAAFTLAIVDAAASAPGRSVGNCDRGAKKIVYLQSGKGSAAREAPGMITECRDGSVSVGGDCRK